MIFPAVLNDKLGNLLTRTTRRDKIIAKGDEPMATKYPILLVHGLMLKDGRTFKAFGRIERFLRARGETVFTSDADGVGSIENNALQLSRQIKRILRKTGASKVNQQNRIKLMLANAKAPEESHKEVNPEVYIGKNVSM